MAGSLFKAGAVFLGLLPAAAIGGPLPTATPAPTVTAAPPAATPSPEPVEAISLARETVDAAESARREIARTTDLARILAAIEEAKGREADLRSRLAEIETAAYASAGQISRLRDLGTSDVRRLDTLEASVAGRVKALGAIRDSWKVRSDFWQNWSETLQQSPDWDQLAPSSRVARKRCDSILALTAAGLPKLLDLQRTTVGMRRRGIQAVSRIDELWQERRDKLLVRSEPFLLSAAFVEDLRTKIWQVRPGMPARGYPDAEFLRRNAGVLFLHLFAIAGIAWVARLLRRQGRSEGRWEVLRQPWTIGAFGATAAFGVLYRPSPLVWDLVLWIILAACAWRLAGSLFESPLLRRAVRFAAVAFPLLNLLDWLGLPTPVMRLAVLAGCAGGAVLLFLPLRRQLVGQRSLAALFAVGALILAVVCLAEIAGFHSLGRWLLQSSVATAFVAFIVVVLLRLGRGGLRTLQDRMAGETGSAMRLAVYQVARFVAVLLAAVLVFAAALNTLTLWEVTSSSGRAARILLRAGVTVGSARITVGRVLGSAFVLYVAFLVSVVLRAALREEVLPRKHVDRGVGDAIQTLVHYVVIVIGLALALSALGIRLEAVAIVIGALGVGIGFGLQKVVNNFVSGLILLFERPVRVGDTVVIGGEWGTIRSIGLRSTVLSVFDGSEVIVPNGELVSQRVTNWTLSNARNRISVTVGVAYGSDIGKVFGILSAAAAGQRAVLSDPPPQILFAGFGASSIDFEVRVWLPEVSLRFPTQSELRTDIERRFREAGIEIPFPQQVLHVRSMDAEAARNLGRPDEPERGREGG